MATNLTNLAAVIPAAKSPLVIQETEMYKPGQNELLIQNELIAFNPVESKIRFLNIFPSLPYPAIIGSSFAGTVISLGPFVKNFKIGDRVAVAKKIGPNAGNAYGSFQRYVLATQELTSSIPEGVDLSIPAALVGTLPTVVGMFSVYAGLERPVLGGEAKRKGKKILIYGGSGSVGSLAVQYVAQAGYDVITTSSPRNREFVEKLGAVKVVDHTQEQSVVIKAFVAEGPYDLVVDSISISSTVAVNAAVLAAQAGAEIYTLLPAFGPETLPEGVMRKFESWAGVLLEEKNADLLDWAFNTYLPQGVASKRLISLPTEEISGGLKGIVNALEHLQTGVSGVKLVADPWG